MKVNAHVSTIVSQRIRMGKIRRLGRAGMDGKTGRGQMIGRPKDHEEVWVQITSVVRD